MRNLPSWCDEASYAQWKQNDLAMPSWREAVEKLSDSGVISTVLYPSSDQKAGAERYYLKHWRQIMKSDAIAGSTPKTPR